MAKLQANPTIMRILVAFFQLIRWPNLIFILLTQCLFYGIVFNATRSAELVTIIQLPFILLLLASVSIAAAGYVINDYFDLRIDLINKPDKIVVDKVIKRRWAIVWHLVLSAIGVLLSCCVAYLVGSWLILLGNLICVMLLWFYSTSFKKKLLSGNVIIAMLTAWVIIVVYFFTGSTLGGWRTNNVVFNEPLFFKLTCLYAGFAFIVSLIREVVKDMQDVTGDEKEHCNTMPIAWGFPASKVFVAVWVTVCIGMMAAITLYAWQFGWWYIVVYTIVLLLMPLAYFLKLLKTAMLPQDFKRLSAIIKGVMLSGIISMVFFLLLYK